MHCAVGRERRVRRAGGVVEVALDERLDVIRDERSLARSKSLALRLHRAFSGKSGKSLT